MLDVRTTDVHFYNNNSNSYQSRTPHSSWPCSYLRDTEPVTSAPSVVSTHSGIITIDKVNMAQIPGLSSYKGYDDFCIGSGDGDGLTSKGAALWSRQGGEFAKTQGRAR